MNDPVSAISSSVMQQVAGASRQQQQQGGGRSFESVLQGGGKSGVTELSNPLAQPTQISGAELEKMRVDLMHRIEKIPAGGNKVGALLPELIDSRTRLGLLKEAMAGAKGQHVDLNGRLSQVESEWYQIEGVMKSDRDLSTGELLGLQARLYQVSQHIEVMSKVVDQVTSGIKTILNTNV